MLMHLSEGESEVCTLGENAAFLGGFVKFRDGDILTHWDTELLMEGPNMFHRCFYPVFRHINGPTTTNDGGKA